MLKIVLMLNKNHCQVVFFKPIAKTLANIENLKESKQSLFPLTRITFEIPENEPLAYKNLEDYFFQKRDVDKKNSKKKRRGGRRGMAN